MIEPIANDSGNSGSERMLSGLLNGESDEESPSAMIFDRFLREEQSNKARFLPSQGRIKRMCAAFRSTWSNRELMKRAHKPPIPWRLPEVAINVDPNEMTGD